jgi:methylase of polypeptide subunit release factors
MSTQAVRLLVLFSFLDAGPRAPVAGDVVFYEQLARETGGPVLELGCGTRGIALAPTEKGLDITGVDISDGMLSVTRRNKRPEPFDHADWVFEAKFDGFRARPTPSVAG